MLLPHTLLKQCLTTVLRGVIAESRCHEAQAHNSLINNFDINAISSMIFLSSLPSRSVDTRLFGLSPDLLISLVNLSVVKEVSL
jgi:hypothetical protein